jgi:hypothetical protein
MAHQYGKHASEKAWEGGYNQRFSYDAKTGIIKGWDGRVLDVEGASNAIGAKLLYGPDKGGSHQRWDYVNGEFKTRMGTGFVIDTWGGPDAVKDNAELRMGPSKGGKHQQWDIDKFGHIKSRHNPAFVFDVHGGKSHGGCDNMVLFKQKVSDGDCATACRYHEAGQQRFHYDHKSGILFAWDGRVLDVEGGSKDIGAKLGCGPNKNQDNQKWDHHHGEYITRMGTKFVLDTWGGPDAVKAGGEVRLGPSKGGNHQKWDMDAYGFIRSRHNPKFVIAVKGNNTNGWDTVGLEEARC